ncbi:MAG: hypothetical protein ABSE51_06725 [Terracidiphilus sp.]|jgi:hypothetical protein
MIRPYIYLFWGYLCGLILLTARCGYVAATDGTGPRKGRARLIATLAFASCFVAGPLLWVSYESHLPTFDFEGVVTSVRVENSNSKHFSAQLSIMTTLGGNATVHVSDRSDAWRVGQHLRVRYYGDTGELISATVFDSSGKEEKTINRTAGFSRPWSVLVGFVLAWLAWVRYRRVPNGEFESNDVPDANSPDCSPDLDEQSSTAEVLGRLRTDAKQTLVKQKGRALMAAGAFIASCVLVWPFLVGNSLHRYWDSIGKYLILLSLALLIPFAACVGLAISAWFYYRGVKKITD